MTSAASPSVPGVLSLVDTGFAVLRQLLAPYGLELIEVAAGQPIPGSFWGEPEAGLIRSGLYVRADTPVHSALHEACHWICMDDERRQVLDRDAGGDIPEENAVCYLQILLADAIPGMGRARMCADMDAWGYTFRLDSAAAWFEHDAEDARAWLEERRLVIDSPARSRL